MTSWSDRLSKLISQKVDSSWRDWLSCQVDFTKSRCRLGMIIYLTISTPMSTWRDLTINIHITTGLPVSTRTAGQVMKGRKMADTGSSSSVVPEEKPMVPVLIKYEKHSKKNACAKRIGEGGTCWGMQKGKLLTFFNMFLKDKSPTHFPAKYRVSKN